MLAGTVSLKEITYRNLFGFSQSDRKGGSTGTYTVIVGYQSGSMVHQLIDAGIDEPHKLDLADRPEALCSHPDTQCRDLRLNVIHSVNNR